MKAIKLILAFAVILGIIVGAFFLFSPPTDQILPPMGDDTLSSYQEQFKNDWEQKGDWDEKQFRQNTAIVKQLSANYSVEELRRYNTQLAMEQVHTKVFEEWKSATCNKGVVDKYINALNVITTTDKSASNDKLANEIKQVNSTYREALAVAGLSIGLNPDFNGSSWNSYSSYAAGVKQRRDNVLNSTNYKQYLSNITSIKNGLSSIDSKLSSGRSTFYKKLASSIIAHFDDKKRNYDNLGDLRRVLDKFENESSSTALDAFEKQFADEVSAATKIINR